MQEGFGGIPGSPAKAYTKEEKYQRKYTDLKRRLAEVDQVRHMHLTTQDNERLSVEIEKMKEKVAEANRKRKLLFQQLEQVQLETPLQSKKAVDKKQPVDLETSSDSERPSVPPPSAKKKKKEPVDPNAPRRPANAFMVFCQAERENVIKDREKRKLEGNTAEEEAMGNLTKELGIRWRALPAEEKTSTLLCVTKEYQELFKKETERYKVELAAYKSKIEAAAPQPQTGTAPQQHESAAPATDDVPKKESASLDEGQGLAELLSQDTEILPPLQESTRPVAQAETLHNFNSETSFASMDPSHVLDSHHNVQGQ